jgi:sulfide dehydrogenase cytochrome subunit
MHRLSLCLSILALAAWPARGGEFSPQGYALAAPCLACHGPLRSHPGTPALHALSETQIIEALQAFRADHRPSSIMGRIARGYSDAEIALIARTWPKIASVGRPLP